MTNKTFKSYKLLKDLPGYKAGEVLTETHEGSSDIKLDRADGFYLNAERFPDFFAVIKDAEPEIVRHPIHADNCGLYVFDAGTYIDMAVRLPGFSGFEFEDGSVSLESPWAWRHDSTGLLLFVKIGQIDLTNYTPVLAKFVRVKGAE